MQRRLSIMLVSATVLLAAVASAALFLDPARIPLTSTADDADKVTLYQGGLGFIELTRSFTSTGGTSDLVLSLPPTARFDSLTIEGEGITIQEIRSALSATGSLQQGERVIVHLREGGTFEGTYLGDENGALLVGREGGVTLIERDAVSAIELPARTVAETGTGSVEAVVRVKAPAGTHDVRVTYLVEGAGWTPSYALDANTGALTFYATLTGVANWKNVTLDLVSGSPHVVLAPRPFPYPSTVAYAAEAVDKAADERGFEPSTPLGDLHRYRYSAPVDMARGETLRLAVLSGDVSIDRHRYDVEATTGWGGFSGQGTTVGVVERVELKNTLTEPLPSGTVRVYREGTWIGEDVFPSTPKGDRANLTLAIAQDVKARVVLENLSSSGKEDSYTYALTVENFKDDTVDVRAAVSFPTYRTRLVSVDPVADETLGGLIVWNDDLAAGQKVVLRLTYTSDRS